MFNVCIHRDDFSTEVVTNVREVKTGGFETELVLVMENYDEEQHTLRGIVGISLNPF